MKLIADLHIHSRFSRATSKSMNLEELDIFAHQKGVHVLGTGDFTHPKWMQELEGELEPAEAGLYMRKGHKDSTRFLFTVEISCIYSKGGKVRKVHVLLFAPNLEAAKKLNTKLRAIGNIHSDGRPILGLDVADLARIAFDISEDFMVIPAHCLLPNSLIHTREDFLTPIKNIKKGDFVFTHSGKWKKVRDIFIRAYQGEMYHIQPYYFRDGLAVTPEHPFYVIRTKKNCSWSKGICRPQHQEKKDCMHKYFMEYKPEWVPAHQLEKGDVMVYPRFQNAFSNHSAFTVQEMLTTEPLIKIGDKIRFGGGTRSNNINASIVIDKNFCKLAGYYLAEGHTNGRDAIGFTFHKHEQDYAQEVIDLISRVFGFTGRHVIRRSRNEAIEITFYSILLCKLFAQMFYCDFFEHKAHTKAMPKWALGLAPELQVEIFRGWWRGDKGYTVSRTLMNQMKIILLRLGIIPSIYTDTPDAHKRRGHHDYQGRTIESRFPLFSIGRLTFFEDLFGLLLEPEFQRFQTKGNVRHGWIDKDYVYLPIRDIEITQYKGEVYNLEVEDDNSYVTEFATVHNCWTPWFSVFGSKSGFDSLEECFGDITPMIYAIETGLSSDPAMNWRLSQLDSVALISNSDCHSSRNIAREANVFDCELSYMGITGAIKTKDPKKFLYTIEFFPEEGKYHYDGHRDCNISLSPSERIKKKLEVCPVCGRPFTIGVLSRVEELADRPIGFIPPNAIPFKNLIPLQEIIGDVIKVGKQSKAVQREYAKLLEAFENELAILLDIPFAELQKSTTFAIAQGIMRVREGEVFVEAGYDGVYGKIHILDEEESRPQPRLL